MTNLLSNLFNIRRDEWRRFSVASLMVFSSIFGLVWAENTLRASFVVAIGNEYIPFIFIGDAIIIVISFAFYSFFADRFSNASILITAKLGAAVMALVGLGLKQVASPLITYSFLYYLLRSSSEIVSNHWGTYLADYYDTLALKRIFPALAVVLRLTAMTSALTLPLINSVAEQNVILLVWCFTLVVNGTAAIAMPYIAGPPTTTMDRPAERSQKRASYLENMRNGFSFVSESGFLRAFSFMSIMMMLVLAMLNIEISKFLKESYANDETAIANYTAHVTVIGGLVMLPFQMFVFSRIVSRLGVGRTNLIFPTLTAILSGVFLGFSSRLLAGLMYFNNTSLNVDIRSTNDELLYNAVPLRVRGRTRAFISGIVEPIGTLLGGGILLLSFIYNSPALTGLIVGFGILYIVSAALVTRRYSHALISLLKNENYSLILDAGTDLVLDSAALNYLKTQLDNNQDDDAKIFLARIICEAAGTDAIPIMNDLLTNGSSAVRAGVIDILVNANIRGRDLEATYSVLIHDDDPDVRKAALVGLAHILGFNNRAYQAQALTLLADPDVSVQAHALPGLLIAEEQPQRSRAIASLKNLLSSEDPQIRELGIQAVTETKSPIYARLLAHALTDEADNVQLAAIEGLQKIGPSIATNPETQSDVLKHLPSLVQTETSANIRVLAVRILEWLTDAQPLLVDALSDQNPRVRNTAVETISRIGKPAVGIVEPVLHAENIQLQKMATVALAQIQQSQYERLIDNYARANLKDIYTNYARLDALSALPEHPSLDILRSTIREHNHELRDEIFYMLSAIHSGDTMKIIVEALNSGDPRSIANATEALDSLVAAQISNLLPPLFDQQHTDSDLAEIGQKHLALTSPAPDQVIRDLLSDDQIPWARLITFFVLGEIGATLRQASTQQNWQALLADEPETKNNGQLFTLDEIRVMLRVAANDPQHHIRVAARAAHRLIDGKDIVRAAHEASEQVLSLVERIIFLKGIPFFWNMTIKQLATLASVCEEKLYPEDSVIFEQGVPGGTLYVVVSGRVGIERQSQSSTASARLRTVEDRAYFGESTLFDNSRTTTSAIAVVDTFTMHLHHAPLVELMQEYPDISLELLKVMSHHIRVSTDQLAELSHRSENRAKNVLSKLD
ncbi:MAG: HEAT repeat domain-containing protein [Anaerolineae bacterium]|nr:HEAT repeat domain-containing protein [Anaerolineae bacterium]